MTKMHLSLRVSNLNRSVAFYEAFFGVSTHKRRPGYANFDLAEPPLKFELMEVSPDVRVEPRSGSLDHLGLQVASGADVAEARARLQAAGLATFDETDTTCCYAKQDKIWVHDPDGNEWEVYVLTDDLLDDHEHDHAGSLLAQDAGLRSAPPAVPITPAHRLVVLNQVAAPNEDGSLTCCTGHH